MSTFLAHYLGGLDLTENCHLGLKHLLSLLPIPSSVKEFQPRILLWLLGEKIMRNFSSSFEEALIFSNSFFLGTSKNVSVTSKNFQLSWTVNHALPRFGSKFCLLLEPFNPILLSNRTQFFSSRRILYLQNVFPSLFFDPFLVTFFEKNFIGGKKWIRTEPNVSDHTRKLLTDPPTSYVRGYS